MAGTDHRNDRGARGVSFGRHTLRLRTASTWSGAGARRPANDRTGIDANEIFKKRPLKQLQAKGWAAVEAASTRTSTEPVIQQREVVAVRL